MRLTGIQLGAAAEHGLERRKVELLENQLAQQQRNEQTKQLQTAANDVLDAFSKAVEAGSDEDRPAIIQHFSQLIPQFKESYSAMGLDPRALDARMSGVMAMPTKAQQLQQKATEERTVSQAKAEGTAAGTPKSAGPIVTLEVNGKRRTLRRDDPVVDQLIQNGATEVGRQTVEEEIILPILQKKLSGKELSREQQDTWDLLKNVGLIDKIMRDMPLPGASVEDQTIYDQARAAIASGKDPDAVKNKLRELGGDPSRL